MMEIPLRTAWWSVAAASCCAFLAGRATSIYYIHDAPKGERASKTAPTPKVPSSTSSSVSTKEPLPFPVLPGGKQFPKAKYTGMHFSETVSDYENLHLKDVVGQGLDEECFFNDDGRKQCVIDRTPNETDLDEGKLSSDDDKEEEDDDDEEHLPAGQHLLLDIKNVDSAFLDSEHRLAKAMVEVVTESKLTLLSYHCHKLMPMGVTCVGILLESHISFHTWPEAGVITLDLFTCGSGKLVPVVPIIQKLFAIPQENLDEDDDGDAKMPVTLWSHTFRGFREDDQWGELKYLTNDLGEQLLTNPSMDYKKEIAWAQTPFQRIDIYDTFSESEEYHGHLRSQKDDGSYESLHPKLYRPERSIFLDGVLQSNRHGLEAYHEALVQPVMFSHHNPKRVAIIGGGEGATLREVLKHNTIDVVKMIEIDEEMVKVSRNHLPEWNSCDDFIGSDVEWCGEDSRAELYYEDAISWFKDRFSNEDEDDASDSKEYDEDPFDVLIMDALDPQDDIPFAEILYTDATFVKALYDSLSKDGVMVFQLGVSPFARSVADQFSWSKRRASLINLLKEVGFKYLGVYEDGNCGFSLPWVFLVAMKSKHSRYHWFKSSAELEIEIRNRILQTRSGSPALQYFDGGVMDNYRYPHRSIESTYCKSVPKPDTCSTMEVVFNEKASDVPLTDLDVRMSGVAEGSGRGVYTKVDIKKGSTLGRKTAKSYVVFDPSAVALVFKFGDISQSFDDVYRYIDGYGWTNDMHGEGTYQVDSSILTFANHGCNATYNYEYIFLAKKKGGDLISEQNVEMEDREEATRVFDPIIDRRRGVGLGFDVALRDIMAGEEILCNYVFFTDGDEDWLEALESLKKICSGEEVGLVTQSEMKILEEKDEL